MPSATITVVYPTASDATFDIDYYMKTHMPLVADNWKSFGLTGWKVVRYIGTATGDPPPYTVQAELYFSSVEDFQKAATSPSAETVMGDIPNFSNKQALIMIAEDIGTG